MLFNNYAQVDSKLIRPPLAERFIDKRYKTTSGRKYPNNRILLKCGHDVNYFGYHFHNIDRDLDVC